MAYSNVTPPTLPGWDMSEYPHYALLFNYRAAAGVDDWDTVRLAISTDPFYYDSENGYVTTDGVGYFNDAISEYPYFLDNGWTEIMYAPQWAAGLEKQNFTNGYRVYQRIWTPAAINGTDGNLYLAANGATPVYLFPDGAKMAQGEEITVLAGREKQVQFTITSSEGVLDSTRYLWIVWDISTTEAAAADWGSIDANGLLTISAASVAGNKLLVAAYDAVTDNVQCRVVVKAICLKSLLTGFALGLCGKPMPFSANATKASAVVLEVKKMTYDTYDGVDAYTAEEFILLDIYPKTNGTVSVTYGGLTKTVIDTSGAEKPNAQQVFFGTFYGVTDDEETPESGKLTIRGDYETFGIGTFVSNPKVGSQHWGGGVTGVIDLGTVTSIADSAFINCHEITSVTIPYGVTSIGFEAFKNCNGLTSVTIPGTVTSIGWWAFENCDALTEVTIPDGVSEIDYMTFSNCYNLTSITIPGSVTQIHDRSFVGCIRLTNVIISGDNEHYSFDGSILFNKDKTTLCMFIPTTDNVTIPDTVESIGTYAFYGSRLTEIIIPAGVASIDKAAFYSCDSLTGITFEDTSGWYVTQTENEDLPMDVTDAANNVTLLTDTYSFCHWYKK